MGSDSINLLAVDAGNTRIKWGVHDGGKWNPCGALPTEESARLAAIWRDLVQAGRAIASNVAGAAVEADLRAACESLALPLTVIRSEETACGVSNGYRDPAQLGTDRWAALVAAHHAHRGHKLVVNAGTALTIDALEDGGHFRGGLIVPGPQLMRRSLGRGTAGLRLTDGDFAEFPASTPDAITSGAVQACVGAIERMAAAMAARGCRPTTLILSGGAAGELAPHLAEGHVVNEHLVLDGLRVLARAH